MREKLIAVAGCALFVVLAAPPGAEAGHRDWSFGAGFHVGGVHFQIGLHHPASRHRGYHPGPWFHTSHALAYSGYRCHGGCFRRGGDVYHHYACPLVAHHFRRAGYSPGYYLGLYAPPGYGGYRAYRGYGDHGHHRHYGRFPSRSHGYYLYLDGYTGHHRHRYDRFRGAPRAWRYDRHRGKRFRHFDRGRRGHHLDRHRDFRHERRERDRGRRGRHRGRRHHD